MTTISRSILAMLLALALALPAAVVHADQTSPELDGLFRELKAADGRRAAAAIEKRIWRLWEQHPDADVSHRMQRGKLLLAAGHLDDALIVYDRMVEFAPKFAEAWNKRATIRYHLGDLEGSMRDIQRTLALEPRHFGALMGMSLVFQELEQYGEALDAAEAALEVDPHLPGGEQRIEKLRELESQQQI